MPFLQPTRQPTGIHVPASAAAGTENRDGLPRHGMIEPSTTGHYLATVGRPAASAVRSATEDTRMSDEGSGFWRTMPGMLTAVAGTVAAVASLVAALSQAGLLGGESAGASETVVAETGAASNLSTVPADVSGRWSATVSYPWGIVLDETLNVQVEQGRISGSASYLGVPRAMESAEIEGNRITFFTRAEEVFGDEVRAYQNHYDGLIAGDRIDFSLTDTRGEGPVRFTMRRQ
jgi:hypothetical protein